MGFLSQGILAQFRQVEAKTMLESVDLKRAVETSDGMSGKTQVMTLLHTYAARIDKSTPSIQTQGDVVRNVLQTVIVLPYNADVLPEDQLVVTTQNNRTFHVIGDLSGPDFAVERAVLCAELR